MNNLEMLILASLAREVAVINQAISGVSPENPILDELGASQVFETLMEAEETLYRLERKANSEQREVIVDAIEKMARIVEKLEAVVGVE